MSTYVSVVISPATTTSPVVISVSHATRALRVVGEDRVENRIGDLVGDLVRVALGDRLGAEGERPRGHARRLPQERGGTHGSPTSPLLPRTRQHSPAGLSAGQAGLWPSGASLRSAGGSAFGSLRVCALANAEEAFEPGLVALRRDVEGEAVERLEGVGHLAEAVGGAGNTAAGKPEEAPATAARSRRRRRRPTRSSSRRSRPRRPRPRTRRRPRASARCLRRP